MLFQNYALFPHLTVAQNIAYPLKLRKLKKDDIDKKVKHMIELIKLAGLEDRYPRQLSGGQQQRVAIARAIVTNPRIILADEPTGNLDSTNGNEVMALLKELNKDGATIVMVTHSEENAREANRIVRMMDGCILTESKR